MAAELLILDRLGHGAPVSGHRGSGVISPAAPPRTGPTSQAGSGKFGFRGIGE
jgi:hypothetical protein